MAAVNEITPDRLRHPAELRGRGECVLSLYLNLDPSQFATADARSSVITSVLDAAERAIEDRERPHEQKMSLRRDLERVRELLRRDTEWAHEARGVGALRRAQARAVLAAADRSAAGAGR